MDDANSTASFEDIGDRSQVLPVSGNADDDVPDVCYVLQRREFGRAPVEVRRGRKPIEHDHGDILTEKVQTGKKQSVLEIVTLVSSASIETQPAPRYNPRYGGDFVQSRSLDENDLDGRVVKSERTTMIIRSRHLIDALAAIVSYYPGVSFTGSEVKIEAPYYVLVHHREALSLYKDNQPEGHDEEYASTTRKHIDVLLRYLAESYGQQLREESERHARKTPVATHDRFWLLLRPGEIIYKKSEDIWTPYAISRVYKKLGPIDVTGRTTTSSDYYASIDGRYNYSIDCWNYMYQNGKMSRKMHTFEIPHFSGEEVIRNMPVIPSQFFRGDDGDKSPSDVTAEHIRLGRVIWDLHKKPSYKAYDGDLAQKLQATPAEQGTSPTGYMSGRVIIDGEGYERYSKSCPVKKQQRNNQFMMPLPKPPQHPTPHDQLPYFKPRCNCRVCSHEERGDKHVSAFAEFRDIDPRHDTPPESDLFYHVLSKVIAGFLPGERCWGHFHVERLRDIQFDNDAFRYLVLDAEIKNTVRALTGKFASEGGHVSAWPNDFVKNKGQGRIFLLHGSPGVGKTCTAECVAELTHRPLLSLTSGDLRSKPDAVEQNLNYFLSLGERFGAIVLLDEADVYLGSRRDRDIERNGLVSVFLRALEYYRGVLFLTTNRVQAFDSAFTSRIHVALHYGALTDADRERIWSHGFERLEREAATEGRIRVRVTTSAREYAWSSPDVKSLRWNGREIRNALQTAFALAETETRDESEGGGVDDVVLVTDQHLRAVARMSRGFKNFMRRNRKTRDHDDDDQDDEGLPIRDQNPSLSGDALSSSDDDS